jgi:hypothetical protein
MERFKLLPTYNQAAAKNNHKTREQLALWSLTIVNAIGHECLFRISITFRA